MTAFPLAVTFHCLASLSMSLLLKVNELRLDFLIKRQCSPSLSVFLRRGPNQLAMIAESRIRAGNERDI